MYIYEILQQEYHVAKGIVNQCICPLVEHMHKTVDSSVLQTKFNIYSFY